MAILPDRVHTDNTIYNTVFARLEEALRVVTVPAFVGPTVTNESVTLTVGEITGSGAAITLPSAPLDDTKVIAHVREDFSLDSIDGGSGLTVTGVNAVLDNATIGTVLLAGDRVTFEYETVAGDYTLGVELLTVTLTASGGTFSLANAPVNTNQVIIYIDGKAYDSAAGGAVSMVGASGTIENSELGTPLVGGERVVAKYYYDASAQVYETVTETPALTVTATGGVFALSGTPATGTVVIAYVDGEPLDSNTGGALTVTGSTVEIDNIIYGGVIDGTERVLVSYQKVV